MKLSIWTMVVLAFGKMLATGFTLGTGGSGGVFAPALFMGAMLGGAFGKGMQSIFGYSVEPVGFIMVGMAAFFAGIGNVPIAAIIMTSEMAGGYVLKGEGSDFPYWIAYSDPGKSKPGGYLFIARG